MMKWFHFCQNNSGGVFVVDENVAHDVFVQAENARDANRRAEETGLYFDGSGDCPCCGNRWSDKYGGEEGTDVPCFYDSQEMPLTERDFSKEHYRDQARLHFADGRVVAIKSADEAKALFP